MFIIVIFSNYNEFAIQIYLERRKKTVFFNILLKGVGTTVIQYLSPIQVNP
jgi:hypothetical protein